MFRKLATTVSTGHGGSAATINQPIALKLRLGIELLFPCSRHHSASEFCFELSVFRIRCATNARCSELSGTLFALQL